MGNCNRDDGTDVKVKAQIIRILDCERCLVVWGAFSLEAPWSDSLIV